MSFFDLFKKKSAAKAERPVSAEDAYVCTPKLYGKQDGTVFGSVALTENTLSSMPKDPRGMFAADGQNVDEWKICLIGITKPGLVGEMDYYEFLRRAAEYVVGENDEFFLVRGLTLREMKGIVK